MVDSRKLSHDVPCSASPRPALPGTASPIVCVVGAGHGGLATAGALALDGHRVRLLNRSADRLAAVSAAGAVQVEGLRSGVGRLEMATSDPARALDDADIVMVVVPASGHRTIAALCAPHLRNRQIVLLCPGRTFGALEFAAALRRAGSRARPRIAEAQTFLFASRVVAPDTVRLFGVKRALAVGVLDAADRTACIEKLRLAIPQVAPASSCLETSLENLGAVFHPALAVHHAERIERGARFEIYRDHRSPELSQALDRVDAERVGLATALGIPARSARRWLDDVYGCTGPTLADALAANPAYRGIEAPTTTRMRYITEDVPCGLVPMSSLGRVLDVATPTIDALIDRASALHHVDYRAAGRRLEDLGLESRVLHRLRSSKRPPELAPLAA
ncbi:MAG: NAD/NADP octopine/nopaline dehydrogenase family protein [Acidobacteriota bacterium]